MSQIVHGIDLDAIPKKKNGARLWPPKLRKKIVTLMKTIPAVQLGKDLKVHPVQLYQWRQGRGTTPRIKGSASTKSKGAAKPKKKGAKRGPYKKKAREVIDATVLPETAGVIALIRSKRDQLLELVAHMNKTMEGLENGGAPVETVKLSDAMEPVGKRRLSARGRENIAKAARKRWALYNKKKGK